MYASFPPIIALTESPERTVQPIHCIITEIPEKARITEAATMAYWLLNSMRESPLEISIAPMIIADNSFGSPFVIPEIINRSAKIPKKMI